MGKETNGNMKDWVIRFGTPLVLIASSFFFFPKGKSLEYTYEVGQITTEEIIAPFDFPILKTAPELDRDRADALAKVYPLFERREDVTSAHVNDVNEFFDQLKSIRSATAAYGIILATKAMRDTKGDSVFIAQMRLDSLNLFTALEDVQRKYGFDLTRERWAFLVDPAAVQEGEVDRLESFRANLVRIMRVIFEEVGILGLPRTEIKKEKIAVLENGVEVLGSKEDYVDLAGAWSQALDRLRFSLGIESGDEITVGYDILVKFLSPNIIYKKEITEARELDASAKVPISSGIVFKNERIVDRNEKITLEVQQKLESLYAEKERLGTAEGGVRPILLHVGRGLLVAVVLFFFAAFIVAYRPQIYQDNRMVLLIGFIFLSHLAFTTFVIQRGGYSEYLIPVVIASMVLTILVDARIAFIGTVTLALLIAIILGNKLDFVVVSTFAGTASIFSVQRLRARSQLFKSFLYVAAAYIVAITAVELLKFTSAEALLKSFAFAGANAFLSPIIVYGIIGLLEIGFGITTDMALLELSDLNRPLLKQLAVRAPGTYHHSVIVGNLAEEAAAAIDANSLLARVGSYYHDIGKMNKPEYFAENQMGAENRHEMLRPNLSALILASHVREGVELAQKYKLPGVIIEFITGHHGTSRMEFFYKKAVGMVGDESLVNEADFRYPGPKPTTRETGIVMLCESIEAATRSIKDKTLNRLSHMVDSMVEKRLKDGELDYCNLTLEEIKKIKDAILPILVGMYHLRVEYPEDKKKPEEQSGLSPGDGKATGAIAARAVEQVRGRTN